jgi:hypothetical protein
MNKAIFSLTLCALAFGTVRAEYPVGDNRDGSPLPVAIIDEISVMIAGKWYIRIRAEGPSYLNYGAGPTDVAMIPEGKVPLEKIYGQIKDRLAVDPEELESRNNVLVNFTVKNGTRIGDNVEKWMEASEAYRIFDEMVANGKPYERKHFETILNRYPANPDRKLMYHYGEDGSLQVTPDPRAEVEVPEETERPSKVKDGTSSEGEPHRSADGHSAKRQPAAKKTEHSPAWPLPAVAGGFLVVAVILLALFKFANSTRKGESSDP